MATPPQQRAPSMVWFELEIPESSLNPSPTIQPSHQLSKLRSLKPSVCALGATPCTGTTPKLCPLSFLGLLWLSLLLRVNFTLLTTKTSWGSRMRPHSPHPWTTWRHWAFETKNCLLPYMFQASLLHDLKTLNTVDFTFFKSWSVCTHMSMLSVQDTSKHMIVHLEPYASWYAHLSYV